MRRPRRPPTAADVGAGFWVTEAPALQNGIVAALRGGERGAVPAELSFDPGADGRVVVVWRNHHVGFVPDPPRAAVRAALDEGLAPVAAGIVRFDGALWRVWVGDPPTDGFPAVPAGHDTLPTPPRSILGVPLDRLRPPHAPS